MPVPPIPSTSTSVASHLQRKRKSGDMLVAGGEGAVKEEQDLDIKPAINEDVSICGLMPRV